MKRKENKQVLLKGDGINQHTLYGKFVSEKELNDFAVLEITEDSILKHELPNGKFGEHNALAIEKGQWVMGKQVEYNPFTQKVTRVWD
jgi:hypothetical protein